MLLRFTLVRPSVPQAILLGCTTRGIPFCRRPTSAVRPSQFCSGSFTIHTNGSGSSLCEASPAAFRPRLAESTPPACIWLAPHSAEVDSVKVTDFSPYLLSSGPRSTFFLPSTVKAAFEYSSSRVLALRDIVSVLLRTGCSSCALLELRASARPAAGSRRSEAVVLPARRFRCPWVDGGPRPRAAHLLSVL